MKLSVATLAVVACLGLAPSVRADKYIVFVHGLAGFGPHELFGLDYFGFSGLDLKNDLETDDDHIINYFDDKAGVHTLYATVGPFSSLHDRACELWAQIVGARVDFGAAHSARHGHARYGKDYSGTTPFFPQLANGQGNLDGHTFHLVGHSLGGATIRYFEYILNNGIKEEVDTGAGHSAFFDGNRKGHIRTMHSISGTLNGSTLHAKLGDGIVDIVRDLIIAMLTMTESLSWFLGWDLANVYDFDLAHHGIEQGANENLPDYVDRIFGSPPHPSFSSAYTDLAHYWLGTEAMTRWNRGDHDHVPEPQTQSYHNWDANQPVPLSYSGTYYFGWATSQSWIQTEGLLQVPHALMSGYRGGDGAGNSFDSSWDATDGLVSLKGSMAPLLGYESASKSQFSRSGKVRDMEYKDGSYGFPWRNCCAWWNAWCNWWEWRDQCSGMALQSGVWYTDRIDFDHLQIVGLKWNILDLTGSIDDTYQLMWRMIQNAT